MTDIIPSESIHVIKTIAECQSFANAAKVLNKVPSAISYTVKRLEETLEIQLFDRSNKTVVLTSAGQHLVDRGNLILRDLGVLANELQQVDSGIEPVFKISFNHVLNSSPILPFLESFSKHMPNTKPRIVRETHNGSWDSLFYGDVDLAIGTQDAVPPGGGYSTRGMGKLPWVFCVGPNHPLTEQPGAISNENASAFPAVLIEDTSKVLSKQISWSLPKQKTIHVPDWKTAIETISKNLGVGYLPRTFAQYYLDTQSLFEKELMDKKESSLIYIAWKTNNRGMALKWCLNYFNQNEEQLENVWLNYQPDVSAACQIP